jgi:hypothetical protein
MQLQQGSPLNIGHSPHAVSAGRRYPENQIFPMNFSLKKEAKRKDDS